MDSLYPYTFYYYLLLDEIRCFAGKVSQWKLDIAKIQSSEEVEITPKEAKDMLKELKLSYPYTHYDSKIPDNHALRVVKTPDPEEMLRGDEWDLMYKTWIKDIGDHLKSNKFQDYAKARREVSLCSLHFDFWLHFFFFFFGLFL